MRPDDRNVDGAVDRDTKNKTRERRLAARESHAPDSDAKADRTVKRRKPMAGMRDAVRDLLSEWDEA